jgi:drug/metabolite transporter (DMT)-like permease
MLPVLLAALSAAVWGTGDFCGGKATQRSDALAVTVLSQLASLPVLAACVAVFSGWPPRIGDLAWGALAGIAGFLGILLLYRGLASGSMAIFAPISAVTTALVPLIVGLVLERPPSALALTGAGCAIVAIGLVSTAGGERHRASPRVIGLALMSGLMFGVFFAILGQAGPSAGLWPLVGVRIGSLAVGLTAVLASGTSLRIGRASLRWAVVAGPLDILANVLYLVAVTHGALAVVAPIAALYPVSTVLLAFRIDRERVRPVQLVGLGLAVTALVLVAT